MSHTIDTSDDLTSAPHREASSLSEIIATAFSTFADKPAFATVGDKDLVTYGQAWERISALRAAWNDELSPGDFVAILGFTSPDFLTIDLATTLMGAPNVPIQLGMPTPRIAAILDETQPKIFAVSAAHAEAARDAIAASTASPRVVIFDGEQSDLDNDIEKGSTLPVPEPVAGDPQRLVSLIYTSGSTGSPKGAMYLESLVLQTWQLKSLADSDVPLDTVLHFLPMSHMYGRGWVIGALTKGGLNYFASAADMSSLFDDLAATQPTALSLVPRVCELIHQQYLSLESTHGTEGAREIVRDRMMGGRVAAAMCGGAALSHELQSFVEWLLGVPIQIGYGSTEAGKVLINGTIARAVVEDYRLIDVPELGYFTTDKPYPRGEFLVKSRQLIPGYFHATTDIVDDEGFYHTGDVMAETDVDTLEFVDRRNNVLKLSQGEFVAISQLEAEYAASPAVHQIFLYGTGERSYLLAVAVPADHDSDATDKQLRNAILESLGSIARDRGFASYEVPRDIIIEPEPFSQENGLRSGIGKLARPALVAQYGPQLDEMYSAASARQNEGIRELNANDPVSDTVLRAAALTLGTNVDELSIDSGFGDLGGDSLSALSLSTTLERLYEVPVPVPTIVGPTATFTTLIAYIEQARSGDSATPTAASVHGRGATVASASELQLATFIDPALLSTAPTLPQKTGEPQTVLLTGATGFLGRFLLLEWLRRVSRNDGRVIALVRGADDAQAQGRVFAAIGDADSSLADEFSTLAQSHLTVVVGDFASPSLGVDDAQWDQLARSVDHIVHCGALVNHVLPYDQLFGPNVVGTSEIIRLASTTTRKSVDYVSTVAVVAQDDGSLLREDDDVRVTGGQRRISGEGYANGYAVSKWAGEVLLNNAADELGLPVRVFRSDMILAHREFHAQFNPVDQFTRLLLSIAETGLAPQSFYIDDGSGQSPHYDGLPVDFTAKSIVGLGAAGRSGSATYHLLNVNDDGISLDDFVDWIAEEHPIQRVADYAQWLAQFEAALTALPDEDRQRSVLPLLHSFAQPTPASGFGALNADRFRDAVRAEHIGTGDIPHLDRDLIDGYLRDFDAIGWLRDTVAR